MPFVYLSLGSNLGNKEENLHRALSAMKERNFWVKQTSHMYRTEPVGNTSQDWFLNMCVLVDTRYPPETLLKKCQEIESDLGRISSSERWAPRVIDIDIIFYEDMVVQSADLIIPHPRMHERRFVLVPLHEIAPLYHHPVLKKTVHRLLMDCPDMSRVELWTLYDHRRT